MKYYTGFFIEKALSIDNVFVISLIFTYFAIPKKPNISIAPCCGALAVIVLRGIFIAAFVLGEDKFPPALSLGVTAALIAGGIGYSLWKTQGAEEADRPVAAADSTEGTAAR